MPTRRVLRSVLHNFLGTFVSRYSDYQGYWLIGQIEPWLGGWEVDLLAPVSDQITPEVIAYSHRWAKAKFFEQLEVAGVQAEQVTQALTRFVPLVPTPNSEVCVSWRGGTRLCREVVLGVWVMTDTGRRFSSRRRVFVASHDPHREFQSGRDDRGTMDVLSD